MQTSAGRDCTLRSICFSRIGRSSRVEPPVQVLDHLADGDGLFVHLQHGPGARAVQNLLEGLDQVDDIGGQLGLCALGVHELADRRIAQHRVFNLLFLQEHLRRGLELFVLEQAVDEFVARIFLARRRERAGRAAATSST